MVAALNSKEELVLEKTRYLLVGLTPSLPTLVVLTPFVHTIFAMNDEEAQHKASRYIKEIFPHPESVTLFRCMEVPLEQPGPAES